MRTSRRWHFGLALAAALAACGGGAPSDEPEGAGRETAPVAAEEGRQPGREAEPAAEPAVAPPPAERMRGTLSLSGTDEAPMVRLRPEEGRGVTLTGELLGELSRLSGAAVAVQGTKRGSGMMAQFEVAGYEIVGIDGERPVVGVLVQERGSYRIGEGGAAVTLAAVPDNLAQNVGAKVWVTGAREGTTLTVQSFGIIRSP